MMMFVTMKQEPLKPLVEDSDAVWKYGRLIGGSVERGRWTYRLGLDKWDMKNREVFKFETDRDHLSSELKQVGIRRCIELNKLEES